MLLKKFRFIALKNILTVYRLTFLVNLLILNYFIVCKYLRIRNNIFLLRFDSCFRNIDLRIPDLSLFIIYLLLFIFLIMIPDLFIFVWNCVRIINFANFYLSIDLSINLIRLFIFFSIL